MPRRPGRWAAACCLAVLGIASLAAAPTSNPGQDATTAAAEGDPDACAEQPTAPFGSAGAVVDLLAEPDLPGRLWATDGSTIVRSGDAGCTWTDVFALQVGLTTTGARIVELASPSGDPDWVSALIVTPSATIPGQVGLRVVTTRDAGATWKDAEDGLPDNVSMDVPERCNRTCGMVGTTDGDDTLYLWFTEPQGVTLYWSISGGRTFTVRSEPARPLSFDVRTDPPAQEMVTDDPGYFGVFGTRAQAGATVSDDGGRTWNDWPEHFGAFDGVTFGFPDEAVGQAADRPVDRYLVAELGPDGQLLATHAKFTDVLSWHRAPSAGVEGAVTGLTSLGDASIVAVTTTEGIWVGQQVGLAEVVWRPLVREPGLLDVQFAGGRLWAHDGTALRSIDPDVLPALLDLPPKPVPPAELDLPPFDPANPIGPLPGTFDLADDLVRVDPGEQVEVDLVLDVPPTDPAVDLFFLIARHESMQDDLDTLTREFFFIVKDLVDRGVDVNVGVGVYGSQVRYHRYRDIGPPDDEFKQVLDDIYGYGPVAAAYTAIDAAMVGTVYPDTPSMFATFKGLETHWRPNTTRVVVHVTDQEPRTDDEIRGEDGATVQQAHDALVEVGALHLGLVSGDAGSPLSTANATRMQDLARVSGAIAVNPIDCNGDGIDDVAAGEPIVCFVPAGGTNEAISGLGLLADFGDVIVDVLDAATQVNPLTLHTTAPELVPSFRTVGGVTSLDLLAANAIPTVATIQCSVARAGTVTTTRLSAASGTRGLATTTLEVQCGDLPVAPPPPPAPAPAPVEAPVLEQPVLAPPPPVPAPAPVPVPQVPASTNVLPNAGVAGVEQQEEQRAAAHLGKDEPQQQADAEREFAFSAVRSRESSPAPTLALGAVMSVGAAGLLARRRQQASRPAWVRTGR